MKPRIVIPPNGWAGTAQQTQATQLVVGGMSGRATGTRRRKRKSAAKRATPKRRTRRASSRSAKRPARMVKGSAAAKRYMAKLRRMRRK